jgi:hypothetical protein
MADTLAEVVASWNQAVNRARITLTIPRCSLCGALENLDLIAAHNIRCANGGERSYAMPLVIGERRAPSIELAPRHPAFTRLLEAR